MQRKVLHTQLRRSSQGQEILWTSEIYRSHDLIFYSNLHLFFTIWLEQFLTLPFFTGLWSFLHNPIQGFNLFKPHKSHDPLERNFKVRPIQSQRRISSLRLRAPSSLNLNLHVLSMSQWRNLHRVQHSKIHETKNILMHQQSQVHFDTSITIGDTQPCLLERQKEYISRGKHNGEIFKFTFREKQIVV